MHPYQLQSLLTQPENTMRIYTAYLVAAVMSFVAAGNAAASTICRYRADDGNWFVQVMEALANITYC